MKNIKILLWLLLAVICGFFVREFTYYKTDLLRANFAHNHNNLVSIYFQKYWKTEGKSVISSLPEQTENIFKGPFEFTLLVHNDEAKFMMLNESRDTSRLYPVSFLNYVLGRSMVVSIVEVSLDNLEFGDLPAELLKIEQYPK